MIVRHRRGRTRLTQGILAWFVTAIVMASIFAASAFAATEVWLKWGLMQHNQHLYSGIHGEVHQAQSQPAAYNGACSNIYKANHTRVFKNYYCGTGPGKAGTTPYVKGTGTARSEVWNSNPIYAQDVWAWDNYSQ